MMPRYICHYKSSFFEWSTVVDAPISGALNREDFEKEYEWRYGEDRMLDLSARLQRAIDQGTSSMSQLTLEELIEGNRAGPEESCLSFEEVLKLVGIGR